MDVVLPISVFFGIEGLFIGSFLNVVIDRLPEGKNLGGRSSCDYCKRTLSIFELIPILSYAFQKGKSACCKTQLKIQYSLIEATTGILFFLSTYLFLSSYSTWSPNIIGAIISILIMISASIVIIMIDFRHHIIPDSMQLTLFIGVIAYHLFSNSLQVTIIGEALVVALPILLLYLVTGGKGMGYGDIKLQMSLGLLLGIIKGCIGLYIGFIIGAVYGMILIIFRKAGRKSHIAFGPFLLFGAWISFWWGDILLQYIRMMF